MSACLVGIGNTLRGDDGIGPAIVKALGTSAEFRRLFHCLTIETDLFALSGILSSHDLSVLIDALPPGPRPGEVRVLKYSSDLFQRGEVYSLHDMDLLWQIQHARCRGSSSSIILLGIQSALVDFGLDFSPQLSAVYPVILRRVAKLALKRWHKEFGTT